MQTRGKVVKNCAWNPWASLQFTIQTSSLEFWKPNKSRGIAEAEHEIEYEQIFMWESVAKENYGEATLRTVWRISKFCIT